MTDFLNDDATFMGDVTTEAELIANGGLTIGPGGARFGQPASEVTDSWPVYTRVRVADEAERDELVAWRVANAPISASNPVVVWRADGSSTGVEEISTDGVNWYAESPSAGDVEITLCDTAPYGWLLLQGQTIPNAAATYPALWEAASPQLRSGSSLVLPDLRGRVVMGAGQGPALTLRILGEKVGRENETLTLGQMPFHWHSGTTQGIDRSLNHSHMEKFGHLLGANPGGTAFNFEVHDPSGGIVHEGSNVYDTVNVNTPTNLDHLHEFLTDPEGNDQPHPNVQPSVVLNYKVKV